MDDFARAFNQADRVFFLDIYAASEQPIPGITAEVMAERTRQFGHRSAEYVGTLEAGVNAITKGLEPGDLVITLGAGTVTQAADLILEKLRHA